MSVQPTCSVAMLFLMIALTIQGSLGAPTPFFPHRHSQMSFEEVSKCSGTYDKPTYTWMVDICLDCDYAYPHQGMFKLCLDSCFDNEYFEGCQQALGLSDKKKDAIEEGLRLMNPRKRKPMVSEPIN